MFTQPELDYLATQRLGRLATVQPDGTLQVNPVGFTYNPDTRTIDIGGYNMTASRKYRNVAANGRAAFVVDGIAETDRGPLEMTVSRRTVPESDDGDTEEHRP